MEVFNLKNCDYGIVPQVARLGVPCRFTLRGLGMDASLTPGATYCLRAIPQEENNSSVLLTFSDWTKYDGVVLQAEADGALRFAFTFTREQIYTLRLAEEKEDGSFAPLGDLRVFAAAEDLYGRIPMRGNTHCHVCTSVDGHEDPFLTAAMYRKAGFDFLAITDHHKIDGSALAIAAAKRIPSDLTLFYGEEVHVPNAYIHAVNVGAVLEGGVGLDAYYHSHKEETEAAVAKLAREAAEKLPDGVLPMDYAWRRWIADTVHANGGAAILAHPFWEWDAHNTRDDVFRYFAKEKIYDGAEILHGQEPGCRDVNMQTAFWNDLRAEGIFISPLGADDAHRRHYKWDYDSSFNEVYSVIYAQSPTLEGFKEALHGGYTAAVETYELAPQHVTATYRLTKFTVFLLENYFPAHDELCFEEGRLMRDAYLGDPAAVTLLQTLNGRVKRYTDRFFGRDAQNAGKEDAE